MRRKPIEYQEVNSVFIQGLANFIFYILVSALVPVKYFKRLGEGEIEKGELKNAKNAEIISESP